MEEKMKNKTVCQAVGAGILAVGIAVVLTGHVFLTYLAGLTFGIYSAGWAVAFIEKRIEKEASNGK